MRTFYKYLTKEIILLTFFLLLSLFFLYALIDYSIHLKTFNQERLGFGTIAFYYLWQFIQRLDILFPLSLMLATIKILTTMNQKCELVALFASGVSFKRVFKPFFWIACIVIVFTYMNFEYLQPTSYSNIQNFEKKHFKKKDEFSSPVFSYTLPNDTLLLYQHFDSQQKVFSNVFLVVSCDEIYRMKTLILEKERSIGKEVDILIRNKNMEMTKQESLETHIFSKIEIEEKKLSEKMTSARMQSMTELSNKLSFKAMGFFNKMSDKEAEVATYFSYKLFIPLLALLAVLAPTSFCIQSNRKLPLFLIYSSFLFGILSFFTLINSTLILSTHQILPPFWAICAIFLAFFTYFGFRYAKL